MDINKLSQSIKNNEALRLTPYVDSTGNLTIGYGINLKVGITLPEANFLLNNRIQSTIAALVEKPWFQYIISDDVRSRAITEMAFNLGIEGLSGFKIALASLAKGDYEGAASGFLDSEWAIQVGDRATQLTQMIATGKDPS